MSFASENSRTTRNSFEDTAFSGEESPTFRFRCKKTVIFESSDDDDEYAITHSFGEDELNQLQDSATSYPKEGVEKQDVKRNSDLSDGQLENVNSNKEVKCFVQEHDLSVAQFTSDESDDEPKNTSFEAVVGNKVTSNNKVSIENKTRYATTFRNYRTAGNCSSDEKDSVVISDEESPVASPDHCSEKENIILEVSDEDEKAIVVSSEDDENAIVVSSEEEKENVNAIVVSSEEEKENVNAFQASPSGYPTEVLTHDVSVENFTSDKSVRSKNCEQRNVERSSLKDTNEVQFISGNEAVFSNKETSNDLVGSEDISTDQVVNIENKIHKMKASDIRSYVELQKPKVTQSRYQLKCEIDALSKEVDKLKKTLKSIDVSHLPDNGMKLQNKLQESMALLKKKERELKELPENSIGYEAIDTTEDMKPVINHRLPIGFGAKALETQIREKTLTHEALQNLHGSISACPGEDVFADDPLGLKSSVKLMPHQKHALAWMQWREKQKPCGGILADDMGLGKTLTMISLVLTSKEGNKTEKENEFGDEDDDEDEDNSGFPLGGTLVVCPASLLLQWEDEIKKHCKRGSLDVEVHHGSCREKSATSLARSDMVITTYSIVRSSENAGKKDISIKRSKKGVLHRVKWSRIILDEGHVVRNHKSQQSVAVCLLMGRKRWVLTGTPVHNKELDLYALLKFLRCSPFDDYYVWRRWVDTKNTAGLKRLNTVIHAILLRRTKTTLQEKGELDALPEKSFSEILVHLDEAEYEVYTKVLVFSKTLFAQFLQQRAEKEQMAFPISGVTKYSSAKNLSAEDNSFKNHPELAGMFSKMQQMQDVKTHVILVLLLRLRQICVHPGLIKAMLNEEATETDGFDDSDELDGDVLSRFGGLSLDEEAGEKPNGDEKKGEVLQINNPVFDLNRESSKMKAIFDVLEEKVLNTSDKAIIVSQWTSMLNIIHKHLLDKGLKCGTLTGEVHVKDRMDIVNSFNNSRGGFQILLLSLTAGGVGLNLVGGNHLLLVDLHWNPQLESQAFDRIYRFGQKKHVFIYKFICQETIEERIKALQESKLALADGVLSGSVRRNANKLTLNDLKTLFSM